MRGNVICEMISAFFILMSARSCNCLATIGGATKMTPIEIKSRLHQEKYAGIGTGAGGFPPKSLAKAASFQRLNEELTTKMEDVFANG
jgi:hypothetical protein